MKIYLTTLDGPFGTGDITVPGKAVLIATDVPTFKFDKLAEITGYFKGSGRSWWEDGLQSSCCSDVHVFTDNPDSGLFCGFSAMNDRRYFYLLGKLKMNDFATEIMSRFQDFLSASPVRIGRPQSAR